MDRLEELLEFQRDKLDQLAMQVPGYIGSNAQVFNENSYNVLKMAINAKRARAEDPDPPEPQTIINIKGGYKVK